MTTRTPAAARAQTWPTDARVRVGPLVIRVVSDVSDSPVLVHFSRQALLPPGDDSVDVTFWLLSEPPARWPVASAHRSGTTARARSFASGYYVTDHFGPALHLFDGGRDLMVVGRQPHRVVWPYLIKWVLQRHAHHQSGLFLKAGLLELDGQGVLVVGRGGAGKTVFLANAGLHGGQFISNSHVLLRDGGASGVASTMRVRTLPGVDLSGIDGPPALDAAEVVLDPADLFPGYDPERQPGVHAVCVLDFRGPEVLELKRLAPEQAREVLAQLALGLNVYRLEEDLLDHLDGDHAAFGDALATVSARLQKLADTVPSWVVSCDVTRSGHRDAVLGTLRA